MFADFGSAGSAVRSRAAAAALFLMVSGIQVACAASRPVGARGPEADALARRMLVAVNDAAWRETGAIRWTFRGQREHLWDRNRSLIRVRWGKTEVLLDLTSRDGIVRRKGRELLGREREKLLQKAYAYWVNDSFWLNPVSKVFDEGTERSLVALEDGGRALLVEYTSGGLTPGDAYLWLVDERGLPTAWRMWTSNLPIGGMKASWEDWTTLATGVRIALRHDLSLGSVVLTEVAARDSLESLAGGADPFLELIAREP